MDHINYRIQKFSSNGRFVAAVGTHGSSPLQFKYPCGIGFNKKNGKLYVCDSDNHRIQILGTDLTLQCSFGSRGSGNGKLNNPNDIAFDQSNNVYVVDKSNHHIQVFTPKGQYLRKFGSEGTGAGNLSYPVRVALDRC